ncbi:conserved hypothetical protein [Treponema primitia ZAS-2]|uniref:Sulfatase-modifying factor enzyme-like domain-containing protein n=1 Tax=Treponema primitia (strain ATCC BAA-887 / DSM 12427 / ZAS-2) TaxID=545694 RepID=F5YLY1_TREPZ|nr:formylglycine-generating enzyme family protein [Treponema primitia]AEF86049.1 conserved hypothetical protein [Treponema primitia ZAS-2]
MAKKTFAIFLTAGILTAWYPGVMWGGGQGDYSTPANYAEWAGNAAPYQTTSRNLAGSGDTLGIGVDTRNEIAGRREWVEKLNQCDNYVANYIQNTPLPTYLVYSTELGMGEIDWDRETRALSFRIALYPDKNWAAPIQRAVNEVYAGLAATGKASAWELLWPGKTAAGGESPARAEVKREYLTAIELVNESGQVIGNQSVSLTAGWKTGIGSQYAEHAEVASASDYLFPRVVAKSTQTAKTVTFPYVDAQKITGKLSIRIARLNGRSAETAARENGVHILTETNYARILEQQLNMKSVSGGTFMMGGTEKDEQPRRRETVAGFYMGKYEVTEGEYNTFLSATGRRGADNHNSDDVPVSVNWFDAVRYCNWLSEMTGRRPAYTINRDNVTWNQNADGFRLPTEAEWEYACRAGTTTAYSFGASISESQANYNGEYGRRKAGLWGRMPVGSFAPNPWGFYDMHGNVWEWCWDAKGMQRAERGGDYLSWGEYLRSAFRNWSNPTNGAGFRIVSSARTMG